MGLSPENPLKSGDRFCEMELSHAKCFFSVESRFYCHIHNYTPSGHCWSFNCQEMVGDVSFDICHMSLVISAAS
jgi:hypothetical protein